MKKASKLLTRNATVAACGVDSAETNAEFEALHLSARTLADLCGGAYALSLEKGRTVSAKYYLPCLNRDAEEWQQDKSEDFLLSLMHQDDMEHFLTERRKCIDGTLDELDVDFRVRDKSGAWVWLNDRGKVVAHGPDGLASCLTGALLDVSERKYSEIRLSMLQKISSAGDESHNLAGLYEAFYAALPVDSNIVYVIASLEEDGRLTIQRSASEIPLEHADNQCLLCGFRDMLLTATNSQKPFAVSNSTGIPAPVCGMDWFSFIANPLVIEGRCLGLLIVYSIHKDISFSQHEAHLFEMAAKHMAIAVNRKCQELTFSNLATRDPLTKLANRCLLQDRIEQAIERMRRSSEYICAALMLDLDHFKDVNDEYGHGAGDELLKNISDFLQNQMRGIDTVCRLGGDEFVILLENISSSLEAISVAERILSGLKKPLKAGPAYVQAGVSIGIIADLRDYSSVETILHDVDLALYRSKQLGRNRYQTFNENMSRLALEAVNRENEFHSALRNQEFFIVYQPVYSLEHESLIGFEALARWMHPERGLLLPDEFIPQLEQSGCMWPFGLWALKEACGNMRFWRDKFRGTQVEHPQVFINIFRKQACHPKLLYSVQEALDASGLPPEALCLEIAESSIYNGAAALRQNLLHLKNLGVKTCINTFEGVLPPFSGMWLMPMSSVKFACSQMLLQDGSSKMLRHIMYFLKMLNFQSVLVCVESEEHLEFARSLKFDAVQGNFMGEPMTREEVEAHLQKNII